MMGDLSVQALSMVYIPLGQGQDEVPGPAFFVEVNPENLALGQGQFVESKTNLPVPSGWTVPRP